MKGQLVGRECTVLSGNRGSKNPIKTSLSSLCTMCPTRVCTWVSVGLVPRPPLFFVFWFVFRIIPEAKEKQLIHHVRLSECVCDIHTHKTYTTASITYSPAA